VEAYGLYSTTVAFRIRRDLCELFFKFGDDIEHIHKKCEQCECRNVHPHGLKKTGMNIVHLPRSENSYQEISSWLQRKARPTERSQTEPKLHVTSQRGGSFYGWTSSLINVIERFRAERDQSSDDRILGSVHKFQNSNSIDQKVGQMRSSIYTIDLQRSYSVLPPINPQPIRR
jgi:hypothetical protein